MNSPQSGQTLRWGFFSRRRLPPNVAYAPGANKVSQMVKQNKIAIFAVMLTLAAYAISASVVPPLASTIATDIGIATESFGYVFALQFSLFALGCLLGGWLSERFGLAHRTLLLIGLFGIAFTLACGCFISSYAWLLLWTLPLGLAGGLTESFGSVMICDYEGPDSSKLINLSQVFFCLGAVFGPHLVAQMLKAEVPWPATFVVFGAIILTITLVFIALTRRPAADSRIPESCADPDQTSAPAAPPLPLWRDPVFYLLGAFQFLYVAVEVSAACWVSVFFEQTFDVSVSSAAWRPAVFWGGVGLGRALMLILPGRWTLWPAAFCGASALLVTYLSIALCDSTVGATLLVFAAGIAAGPLWPVGVSIAGALRGSARFTSGIIACGAVGAALGPLLSSLVIRHLGLARLFPALAVGCVPLVISLWLAQRKARPIDPSTT